MPAVKKPVRKKTARKGGARRKTPQGAMERLGASADVVLRGAWSRVVTGTAVGVTALGLLALLALFVGGYFMDFGARMGALTSSGARLAGFSVARVTLKGGAGLSEREVMQALWSDTDGSVLGRSLFHVDAAEARARLEALGPVRHAAVAKLWPDTLHVSVSLRTPEALWQDKAGTLHVVDADGMVLRPASPTELTDLPVIVGTDHPAGAQDLMAALRRRPALLGTVAAVLSINDRRYDLRFRNDFTAKLPEAGDAVTLEEALDRLEGLGAGTGKLAEKLDYIDLRDPKWAYYKRKDG